MLSPEITLSNNKSYKNVKKCNKADQKVQREFSVYYHTDLHHDLGGHKSCLSDVCTVAAD